MLKIAYALLLLSLFGNVCLSFFLRNRNLIPLQGLTVKKIFERTVLRSIHKVTIRHDGKDTVLEVSEDTTILEAALNAGIELPHDCKLGVCLTCPSKVLSGKIDQSSGTLDDSVADKGYALTCCTYPRSDCTITSIEEDELVGAQFSDRY
jgi:ferredoxin